jgi:putative DNA methylase
LKDDYPWFDPPYSERPEEIVQNERRGKSADFFVDRLGRVFAECHRVLKDDGLLIFTFHHNQTWAWEGVARLLLRAGFYVSATPIVRSEGRSGFHSSAGEHPLRLHPGLSEDTGRRERVAGRRTRGLGP